MKGLIIILFLLFYISTQANEGVNPNELMGIKLQDGKLIKRLSLEESTNLLRSLELNENIELRNQVIYPEEVSKLVLRKLTKLQFVEKKPNPQDYN